MGRWFFVVVAVMASCSSEDGVTPVAIDAATDDVSAPINDGSAPAEGDGGLSSCLDRPTDLPRPPVGRLPCELIPPGLSL